MLSGLVTLGTDDSNQVCIAHVILGAKVTHINLHHHQAWGFRDCGVIDHSERDPVKGRCKTTALPEGLDHHEML